MTTGLMTRKSLSPGRRAKVARMRVAKSAGFRNAMGCSASRAIGRCAGRKQSWLSNRGDHGFKRNAGQIVTAIDTSIDLDKTLATLRLEPAPIEPHPGLPVQQLTGYASSSRCMESSLRLESSSGRYRERGGRWRSEDLSVNGLTIAQKWRRGTRISRSRRAVFADPGWM